MLPTALKRGDTIGLFSPSHIATREKYSGFIKGMKAKGFAVKEADNLYKNTYGYLASERERADDLNQLFADPSVQMILFGGGNGALEVLPFLDYDMIRKNPKILCSYSDGTSILNAVHTRTGLVTYYGQAPYMFENMIPYDEANFEAHIVNGPASMHQKISEWTTLRAGVCEGKLIGGYPRNLALMINTPFFTYDPQEKYVLFLEDHESISSVSLLSMFISCIEQHPFMQRVTGLLFGQYGETQNAELIARLTRMGEMYNIPVAYCHDFGHGDFNHAILPIGRQAKFDATNHNLHYFT